MNLIKIITLKNIFFKKTINYKKFSDQLKQQILSIHPNNVIYQDNGVDKTIQLIKDNYPIVINPHLISKKYDISVSCDILIKRLFIEIFKDIKNINLDSIESSDYLIINIV